MAPTNAADPPPSHPFDPTPPAPASSSSSSCPFCRIACAYAPYPPRTPPPATARTLSPALVTPGAYVVYSTGTLVAFLDIQPLSRGHLLLCPRAHRPKLSAVTAREAAALGGALRTLSRALVRATATPDWNVVQNNGAAAAQVVAHVHYHLIPRPELRAAGRYRQSFTMFGRGVRGDLDEEEAEALAEKIRGAVREVLLEEEEEEEKEGEDGEKVEEEEGEEEEGPRSKL
ncbi:HIT-like domain-containing protein [Xylariomycetidae sp. FL0641]|nr:HIT-like domain-containing protein [Xylariomycetidae sp. FL0641]